MDFTLRQEVEGQPRTLSNPRFTWLFFEPGVARIASPFSLPVTKPPGTYRVFVLGSSAAQGDPEPGFGIARVLEVLLRDQYPGVEFEVTSAAATAVNSHFVYAAARACLRLEPDLLVVYAGNNEVVGPYGAGTVLTAAAPPLPLVRAAVAARRHAARAARGERRARRGEEPGTRTGAGRLARDGDVPRAAGAARGPRAREDVPQLRGQPGRHLPPRARGGRPRRPQHGGGEPAQLRAVRLAARRVAHGGRPRALGALFAEAVRLEGEGRWAEAADALQKAAAIDPEHAETAYRLGRCEARLGRDATRGAIWSWPGTSTRSASAPTPARTRSCARWLRREGGVRLVDAEEKLAAAVAAGRAGGREPSSTTST